MLKDQWPKYKFERFNILEFHPQSLTWLKGKPENLSQRPYGYIICQQCLLG